MFITLVELIKSSCVTVRRCARDSLGRDIGAGSGPVLDNDGLVQALRKPLMQS
jgi:hypothetical protein